jgi:meso-butanediol dehydrogenase / (S,S)-butanediol dehydrogenase / diacetyl reductase
MDLKLKDRVVLVTGAGQGIGNAGARRFHDEGAIVYAADINTQQLESLRAEYPGGRMKTIRFDVTSEQSVAGCRRDHAQRRPDRRAFSQRDERQVREQP